ncbi:MAG: diguanylate cyclase [Spirochaetota bacterium]
MALLSQTVRERIERLGRRFRAELPDRLSELERSLERLSIQKDDFEALQELRYQSHRLAGSGATFGLHHLSTLAKKVEDIVVASIENGAALKSSAATELRGHLDALWNAAQVTPSPDGSEFDTLEEAPDDGAEESERIVCLLLKDETRCQDYSDQLGFFGFTVHVVSRPDEIEKLLKNHFRVAAVVDATFLPSGSSECPLRRLSDEFKELFSLIVLCEEDNYDWRLRAVRCGGDAFIAEPVEITHLIDKIETVCHPMARVPYHVVLVDDDPEFISYVAMVLQNAGMITSVVTDPRNLFQVMVESKPELIILDIYMPECDGVELARMIRQQDAYVGIPIVFLSVENDARKQLEAIREGADDFFVKPIDPNHLVTSIRMRAQRTRDMRFFMERDSLTGLLNHSSLREKLSTEVQRARRMGTDVCFAMVDLDHFKSVNDTYGHLAGDRVLKTLSRLLSERLRKTDIVGRYGGEEFGVVLFNTDLVNAARVIDEVRDRFSQIRQVNEEESFFVTFSCGVASFHDFDTARLLAEEADRALYRAKEAGRNRVVKASAVTAPRQPT